MIVYTISTLDEDGEYTSEVFTCGLAALHVFNEYVTHELQFLTVAYELTFDLDPEDGHPSFEYIPWSDDTGQAAFHATDGSVDIWLLRVQISEYQRGSNKPVETWGVGENFREWRTRDMSK